MLILAIDTTSEYGGVGVYQDCECLASIANDGPANLYSATLFPMIDRALEEAGTRQAAPSLTLRDIGLFAVANGPGSFTGIRVGLAAAQAWGKAFGRPVRGVSVLEAVVVESQPQADWAVSILDARRGEFYLAVFRQSGLGSRSRFVAEGEGSVLRPHALRQFLEECAPAGAQVVCLVRAHDRLALGLQGILPESLEWRSVPGTLTGSIARLALDAYRQGRCQPPAELDAYYIRRSDAELKWQD